MNWFLPRILAAVALVALGAIAGSIVGWNNETALLLAIVGAAAGASLSAFYDRMKGYRLLRWMRRDALEGAPRDRGFWGELAYRIERRLQLSRRETEFERDQHRDFLAAIDAAPNGLLLLDAQDHIEWCNAVAADHLGLDPVRDRQQRISNLVRDPAFVGYLQQGSFETPVHFAGRRPGDILQVVIRPYGDRGRKLLLSQDITELERTDAMRRSFVANVSHEIRTPLTVVAGFVETMQTLPLAPAERERVLGLMAQQTGRMQALVADLLTLARLEGSPRPAIDQWNSLQAIVAEALAEAQALSGGRHEVQADLPSALEIAGSSTEIRSAIGNLLTNAVRYTPEHGRVRLACHALEDGRCELSVTDSGPGIAREHLPRLTERFYRVDGGRSRDTGGTGLGLSIVKHVMQRHGGEIDISSEVGKGSVFRLVFPAARVRESSRTGESLETASTGD